MKTKITSTNFETYTEMSQSAKNWNHHCSYKLFPYAFEGEHHVIELPHTQLSYSHRKGGFMHDAIAPPHAISIAIIQSCSHQACFDTFKLKKGMILFFDDSQAFNFMSKGKIDVAIISIPKALITDYKIDIATLMQKSIEDIDRQLSQKFAQILKVFLENSSTLDLVNIEKELISCIAKLITHSLPQEPKLTKGEKIALAIRDQVYQHMDGKINIESFAKQYNVSVQTLENAFKSLFGFTPKRFLQLLKLNLIHHDLQNANPKNCTVLNVASKWGFSHMGRFSQDYSKLFAVNPSDTLKSLEYIKGNMISACTSRQEEID
jgi:AraC-like DNA-binding protein